MRKTSRVRSVGVILAVAFAAASPGFGAGVLAQTNAQTTAPPAGRANDAGAAAASPGDSLTTALTGPLGSRSPAGRVTLVGRAIHVTISGDRPGAARGWHVHRGTCARDEGVVESASGYPAIAVDEHGAGGATATLAAPLARDVGYVVDIHDTTRGAALDAIACGVLARSPAVAQQHESARSSDATMNDMSGMAGMADNPGPPGAASESSSMAPMPSAGGSDSLASLLTSAYDRMMADPVIRERAATDPVLRGLVARLAATRAAGGAVSHDAANMSGMSMSPEHAPHHTTTSRSTAGHSTKKATTVKTRRKSPTKGAAKATPRPALKSAKPSMPPGMKMPGMTNP